MSNLYTKHKHRAWVRYGVVDNTPTTLIGTGKSGSSLYSIDVDELGPGTGYLIDLKGETRCASYRFP